MMQRLVWSSAARSHVGMVRKINEDACLEMPRLGQGGLWVVADGMGGHEAGEVASGLIIDSLRQLQPSASLEQFIAAAETALAQVNLKLQEQAAQHYQRRTIGSTVVVLLTYRDQAACLWVGDSRIYRLRGGKLEQLTRDHSHVQELIERGLIDAQEAHTHPHANVITRAVGSQNELMVDKLTVQLNPGDVFLLCSDGLNKMVDDDEIATLLDAPNSHSSAQSLIQTALTRGADDNVTAAVVSIQAEDDIDVGGQTVPIESILAPKR